jgi:hypothetical protein
MRLQKPVERLEQMPVEQKPRQPQAESRWLRAPNPMPFQSQFVPFVPIFSTWILLFLILTSKFCPDPPQIERADIQ